MKETTRKPRRTWRDRDYVPPPRPMVLLIEERPPLPDGFQWAIGFEVSFSVHAFRQGHRPRFDHDDHPIVCIGDDVFEVQS